MNETQPAGPRRDDEERLEVTLERAPVGIAHLDARGGWQLVNSQLSALLGMDRTDLLSTRLAAFIDLDFRRAQLLPAGEVWQADQRYVRPDGEVVWLRVGLSSERHDSGKPRYYVVTVEDISDARASAGALGIAAHELRLPLTHIKGFISSLRRTDVEWDAPTRSEFLADAEREANRLDELIHDLLDESSRPAGILNRTTIQAFALVVTTVSRVRPMIGEREVRVNVPRGLPPLQVEVPAMERVLANLLLNASKYSPRESSIDVNAEIVGDMLELRVEDRGPGVPARECEDIFEPFYRGEVHARGSETGHGLGLAISRAIVTAHGGRIWVSERPGGGASFAVALPLVGGASRRNTAENEVRACAGQPGHRCTRRPSARLRPVTAQPG